MASVTDVRIEWGAALLFACVGAWAQGGGVSVVQREGRLDVTVAERPVLSYQVETASPPPGRPDHYRRSGFLHPLYSPSGVVVTNAFPVGHTHQHAVFHAWTSARFRGERIDFWNQQKGLGTVRHVAVERLFEGESEGGFVVVLQQVSTAFGPVLNERWLVTVRPLGEHVAVDVAIEQTCAGEEPLELLKHPYGGFAVRGSATWNEVDRARFQGAMQVLTRGGGDRAGSNHARAGWIAAWGPIDGHIAGVAAFDHPANFRHPQPIRVHPKMPYFVFAPPALGGFVLEPGAVYRARYRLIAFDGELDAERLEVWYRTYIGDVPEAVE